MRARHLHYKIRSYVPIRISPTYFQYSSTVDLLQSCDVATSKNLDYMLRQRHIYRVKLRASTLASRHRPPTCGDVELIVFFFASTCTGSSHFVVLELAYRGQPLEKMPFEMAWSDDTHCTVTGWTAIKLLPPDNRARGKKSKQRNSQHCRCILTSFLYTFPLASQV